VRLCADEFCALFRTLQAGYNRMESKGLVDTVASIGILSDFFDKNGVGAEQVQEKSAERTFLSVHGDILEGIGQKPLVPVLSYKERLKEMQAASAADGSSGGSRKRKRK